MSFILECKNLTHIYSPKTPFEYKALDGVNLAVERGSFVGIIGHTGSGKSTLIRHFNGLLKPSSGNVLVDGEDIWADPKKIRSVRFKVGLVFQFPEYQLFEETVRKDIAFGPTNMGLDKAEIEARVAEAAEITGLSPELLDKSPFELSGGERRRAAIAGVIAMRPELLVLDEPTAGLDPQGRADILTYIKRYHQTGKSVIIVSHSMEDVAKVAQRLLVLENGKIAMDGAPAEVFEREEELRKMGLETPFINRVMRRLAALGAGVDSGICTLEAAAAAISALAGKEGRL
jgi:energy-coupling factor transport system ATP-binding protein